MIRVRRVRVTGTANGQQISDGGCVIVCSSDGIHGDLDTHEQRHIDFDFPADGRDGGD